MVTRLFLLGAAVLASACSFHTHETVVVQPAQPVYVAAPRERVTASDRRPLRARPEKARPGAPGARPKPRPGAPGAVTERPKPRPAAGAEKPHELRPRPHVDRKKPARRVVVCTRTADQPRNECRPKLKKG